MEHNVRYTVQFGGTYELYLGERASIARFMPSSLGGCDGSAEADYTLFGGALQSGFTTSILLPVNVYSLCLVQQ